MHKRQVHGVHGGDIMELSRTLLSASRLLIVSRYLSREEYETRKTLGGQVSSNSGSVLGK